MQNESDIVRDVSRRLESLGIAYMLTGSMAMNYYAEPRMARDVDVVIALDLMDVHPFVEEFERDYYVSLDDVASSVTKTTFFSVVHNDSIVKVDFGILKRAPYRKAEFERRQCLVMNGFSTWVTTKEDLIISKLYLANDSKSDIQFRDIQNLVQSRCDIEYIDQWTNELGLGKLWNRFRP